jgi:hypothetical protein
MNNEGEKALTNNIMARSSRKMMNGRELLRASRGAERNGAVIAIATGFLHLGISLTGAAPNYDHCEKLTARSLGHRWVKNGAA